MALLLSSANGLFASLTLQYAPKLFKEHQQKAMAKITGYGVTSLTLGLLFGSILSFPLKSNIGERINKDQERMLQNVVRKVLDECFNYCLNLESSSVSPEEAYDDY